MIVSACSSATLNRGTTPAPEAPQIPCRIVQHAMGETCIPHKPQRVVALWTSTFRSALALGIKPTATTWNLDEPFPEYLQGKVDGVESAGTYNEPNLEKILLLKPDLILSITRPHFENIYTQLSNIAPTVVIDVSSPPHPWQKHLEDVAKIFDREQKAKQLVDEYWQRIEQLKQALGDDAASSIENPPLQMQISVAAVGQDQISLYGEKHPVGVVLNDIGLQRPLSQRGDFFVKGDISQEHLSEIDGDVLFIFHWEGEADREALEKLQQNPLWQKLKVVRQNRVYLIDSDHWYAFDVLAMNAVIDDLFKYLVNMP